MSEVIRKPVTQAKIDFHEILKLVEVDGIEVILTRHGKECARIVPAKERAEAPELWGCMQDMIAYEPGAELNPDENAWGELEVDGEKIPVK
jgi:prevent-host-death family protein